MYQVHNLQMMEALPDPAPPHLKQIVRRMYHIVQGLNSNKGLNTHHTLLLVPHKAMLGIMATGCIFG